jgi:hypothetical protein
MFSNRDMRDADNENEPLPFRTLAAATARVLVNVRKQNEERAEDRRANEPEKSDAERQREYVDRRLRELSAFERRARGHQGPR